MAMDLKEWQEPATEVRKVARPHDPIVAKQVESVLERVEIYPPECDDLEAIEEALEEYGFYS